MTAEEATPHPNPYLSVQLRAEVNTPKHHTMLVPAFWDGGRKLVIRITPMLEGQHEYRLTSNIQRWNDQKGVINATASENPGFVEPANVHHWMTTGNRRPHLWLGGAIDRFTDGDDTAFQNLLAEYGKAKCNHIRGLALEPRAVKESGIPDPAYFQLLETRIRAANQRGMTADLILAASVKSLQTMLPNPQQRDEFLRYLTSRFGGLNVTWQGLREFENENGRELLKEIGLGLKKYDPYNHPRSSGAAMTSSPLTSDGWMNFLTYGTLNTDLGAIEHQVYPNPSVNMAEVKGAAAERRHALWNATMNGQYIGLAQPGDLQPFRVWQEFFADTRFWELEPHFDVDGGRAVALIRDFGRLAETTLDEDEREGVEYIVYVEKPGPVEVGVIKHNYDVEWFDPTSGETVPGKKYKGEHFTGEPPNRSHDWVLHLSREGKKQRLQSYKFESKPTLLQEWEPNSPKTPFTIVAPAGEQLSVKGPHPYEVKVTRASRANRTLLYLWTGDVTVDGEGARVLGTGAQGTFTIPPNLVKTPNGVMNLRLIGLSASGKLWGIDKVFRLVP